MFGGIASTLDGPVTLRFPCGFKPPPPDPPANCQVVNANNRLLSTVHRAGAEKQPSFSFKPIRKPTIVRAAGAVVGMFCSDQEKAPTRPGTSYSGYSKVPRFEGQAPTSTCEGVPMFEQWSGTKDCKETLIFYYGPAGLEKPHAYQHTVYPHMGPPPQKFTTTVGTGADKKGVAYGALSGGAHDVQVAKRAWTRAWWC